jgi:HD-GYP domain-containing protein (c-di-GMP phosphodiesterase class II)
LYAGGGPAWSRTLSALAEDLARVFEESPMAELSFALLGRGLAVAGVPVDDSSSAVRRLVATFEQRDVEIVSIRPGVTAGELEALLGYLAADSADVAAVRADVWLRERGADRVSIKHLQLMRGEGVGTFRDVYRRGARALGRELERAKKDGVVSAGALSELARSLMEIVLSADAPIATLLALRDRDDFSLVHSLNVSVLATAQAGALGLSEAEVQEIGVAGLVHDIGKTRVPDGVLQKRSSLTADEAALLARHTHEGARILLDTQGLAHVACAVAYGHHARGGPPLMATELVRIADVFDGLRTLRPFDQVAGARAAVRYMWARMGDRLNSYLLERFAALIGVVGAGDEVHLNTGERVRVVETHPELAFHPVVEVVATERGAAAVGTTFELFRWTAESDSAVLPEVSGELAALDPAELDLLG